MGRFAVKKLWGLSLDAEQIIMPWAETSQQLSYFVSVFYNRFSSWCSAQTSRKGES